MEKHRIELVPLGKARRLLAKDNPKGHDLPEIRASIRRHGWVELPAMNEKTGRLVAGNGRLEALAAMKADGEDPPARIVKRGKDWLVPVLRGVSFANAQEAEAYLIGSNQLVTRGGWGDQKALAAMIERVRAKTPNLAGLGFTSIEIKRLVSRASSAEGVAAEPEIPDPPKKAITKPGDVWTLGDHVLACGDCRDVDLVFRLIDGHADMLHADPPYGMGKESIEGDNQGGGNLDAFQRAWWETARPHMNTRTTCYVWGNPLDLWRWWWKVLQPAEHARDGLTFRNEIVWSKGHGHGQNSETHISYPTTTERALFFVIGFQGFGSASAGQFWEGFEPIVAYLEGEAKACKLTTERAKELTGVAGNMPSHWFSRSQWTLIAKKHYATLAATFPGHFLRPWEELKAEQKAAHQAWKDSARYFHDNAHEKLSDVWTFDRVRGAERFGHETPKPVAAMVRAIKTSCPAGGLVFAPFAGTGPELLAAEQTGRRCRTIEKRPDFCDVVIERWQALTGSKAKRARR